MASVDFQKLKSSQDVKSKLMHCDEKERLKHEHNNRDISKEHTQENIQTALSYDEVCKLYDDTIADLDRQPKANKRKDRVTAFGLNIPISNDLPRRQQEKARQRILDIVREQYPESVILGDYLHNDEQHWYTDAETGEKRLSMPHEHIYIVPVKDGKLNGKWFSSADNMTELNNKLHNMFEKEFNVQFMDGTKTKSKKSMGQLKIASAKKEIEIEKEKIAQERVEIQRDNEYLDEFAEQLTADKKALEEEREQLQKEREEARKIKMLYEAKFKEQEQREQNEQIAKENENSLKARLANRVFGN